MHFYQKNDNESIAASTSAVASAQMVFELISYTLRDESETSLVKSVRWLVTKELTPHLSVRGHAFYCMGVFAGP